jgi:hypothetical protein
MTQLFLSVDEYVSPRRGDDALEVFVPLRLDVECPLVRRPDFENQYELAS